MQTNEEKIDELVDYAIANRLTPNELRGGFDRPGYGLMVFLSIYALVVVSMFVALPAYILLASLFAATSFVAVLKILGLSLILAPMFYVFGMGCFLWAYEGYAYWRCKRYLADRKMRIHELSESHFAAMTPHLSRCIKNHVKHNERDTKARMKRQSR